jgi:hypothetical protein
MVGGRLHPTGDSADAAERADLRQAYERGRRDARAARKRRPLLMTLTFAAAAVGVALLVLAAVHGSFGASGVAVDRQIDAAADQAGPAVRQAATAAGQTLHDAARPAKSDNPG